MKTWVMRAAILLFVVCAVPLSRLLQRAVSNLNEGDGEISAFAINHAIAALPTLVAFVVVSLLIWWCRALYSKENLVLIACISIGTFGLIEFVAEILVVSAGRPVSDEDIHRTAYPYIQFKGKPGAQYQGARGDEANNHLGYGGITPEGRKKAGEYRIIMLGGSTVRFGDPPIPALIQQMFQDDGFEEVRVFNFGVSGSNSGMELARFVFEVLEHEPDMIVSYSGGNDINLPIWMDPRPGYPYNFMIYENHPLYADDYPVFALTAYGSYFFRLLGKSYFEERFSQKDRLRRSVGWNTDEWRNEIAQAYVQNLMSTATVASAIDSEFVAFLQPMLFSKKTLSSQERTYLDQAAMQAGLSSAALVSYFQSIRASVNYRMLAGESLAPIRFEDLSAIYDSTDDTIFPDFIHTGQDAKLLVATKIYETLRNIRTDHR